PRCVPSQRRALHQVYMQTDGHGSQDGVHPLYPRRQAHTIQHRDDLFTQRLDHSPARLLVIKHKMGDLVRPRETLFVIGIRTVYKHEAVPAISQQTASQPAITPFDVVGYTTCLEPFMYVAECKTWQLSDDNAQGEGSRAGQVAREWLRSIRLNFPELFHQAS